MCGGGDRGHQSHPRLGPKTQTSRQQIALLAMVHEMWRAGARCLFLLDLSDRSIAPRIGRGPRFDSMRRRVPHPMIIGGPAPRIHDPWTIASAHTQAAEGRRLSIAAAGGAPCWLYQQQVSAGESRSDRAARGISSRAGRREAVRAGRVPEAQSPPPWYVPDKPPTPPCSHHCGLDRSWIVCSVCM